MRVFVAARDTVASREDDFFHGVEGELVRMPLFGCANSQCGCDRSVAGLASSKASTTFMSVDRPDLDRKSFRLAFVDSLEREGWGEYIDSDEIDRMVDGTSRQPANFRKTR